MLPQIRVWITFFGAITCARAFPAYAQVPQWTTRFNDAVSARDVISDVVADANGNGIFAGTNEAGWTVWKIAPSGQIVWYLHEPGLWGEPKIAGHDEAGNLYLIAGSTIASISPEGRVISRRQNNLGVAVRAAVVTADGHIAATGYVGEGPYQYDAMTLRFDPIGNLEWMDRYDAGQLGDDFGNAVAVGPNGDIFVAGHTGSRTSLRNRGYAILLLRYSPTGERVWQRHLEVEPENPGEQISSSSVAVDNSGNIYVAGGGSSGAFTGRALLFKVAPDGAELWHNVCFATGYAEAPSISRTVVIDEAQDAVYLAGTSQTETAGTEFRLERYSVDGNLLWDAEYGGAALGDDGLVNVRIVEGGKIRLVGRVVEVAINRDVGIVEFAASGELTFAARFDSGIDLIRGADFDARGNAVVSVNAPGGYVDNSAVRISVAGNPDWNVQLGTIVGSPDSMVDAKFDGNNGIYVVGESNRQPSERAYWLWRYDLDGVLMWQVPLPSPEFRQATGLHVDPDGNALVLALTREEATPAGLLKYSPSGSLIWSGHYAGPSGGGVWPARMNDAGDLILIGPGRVMNIDGQGQVRWTYDLSTGADKPHNRFAIEPDGAVTTVGKWDPPGDAPAEIVTIRYGADGTEQWVRRYIHPDSMEGDFPYSIGIAHDRSVFVLCNHAAQPFRGGFFILHYGEDGSLRWISEYGSPDGPQVGIGQPRRDSSGSWVAIANADDPDRSIDTMFFSFSPDGELQWTRRLDGPANLSERSKFVTVLPDGEWLMLMDVYEGSSCCHWNSMLLRADTRGNPLWSSRQSSPAELSGTLVSLIPMDDGGFVSAGTTWSAETQQDLVLTRYGPPPPACAAISPCPGDINGDCQIDMADLQAALMAFGATRAEGFAPANGDVDFDADVDLQDLATLLAAWGTGCR